MTDHHSPLWGVVVTVPEQVEAAGNRSTPAGLNPEIPGIYAHSALPLLMPVW